MDRTGQEFDFCRKGESCDEGAMGWEYDFEKTMELILNICLENELPPEELEDMVLVGVF